MRLRLRRPSPVVLDGRILAGLRMKPWTPAGPIPSVFEFAQACGHAAALVDAAGRRLKVRVVAVLYLGSRIFAGAGEGPARFGVLLHARRAVAAGHYDLDVADGRLAYLNDVPVAAVPRALVRKLGGNLHFRVG
ncbi:MAG: hypothetical protein JNL71_00035 [Rhodospirillales bacterium]|nr:hypothetical protein [Rhodospirillales bacterium]